MSAITIEQIDAKQTELVQLIEKFKHQAKATALTLPAAVVRLLPGERYVGAILKEDGTVDYHLIVLGFKPSGLDHAGAIAWAKTLDGKVANKREIRLVQANAPDLLPTSGWCWLEEEYGSSCAWGCYFGGGGVYYDDRSSGGGAVAVRRFNP